MRLQLLSDLHLETESFEPRPLDGAELLVLAGDIDASWQQFEQFAGWPVPVLMVAGNHEFDGRELSTARPALRARCETLGIRLLECQRWLFTDSTGQTTRFVGCTRWSDFDGLGGRQRERAMKAAAYFLALMRSTLNGVALDAQLMREESLTSRRWLEVELREPSRGRWDRTVVITHFAPSLRSADQRFGSQPGTASFCNADDDLLPLADLWLHGHLHCRHDYWVSRPGRTAMRVVCQARGLVAKGEDEGFDPLKAIELGTPLDSEQSGDGRDCQTCRSSRSLRTES